MKRVTYLLSLILLMSFAVLTSCKDDEATPPPEETEEEIKTGQLTAGDFDVTSVEVGGEVVEEDSPVTLTFAEGGAYTIAGGNLPEPYGTDLPASGTWAFTDETNFDEITLSSGDAEVVLDIIELDDDSLIFQYDGAGVKDTDPATTVEVTAIR